MPINIPEAVNHTQPNWRFCVECFVAFWNDDRQGGKGNCAGGHFEGEGHKPAGFDFYLLADPENSI